MRIRLRSLRRGLRGLAVRRFVQCGKFRGQLRVCLIHRRCGCGCGLRIVQRRLRFRNCLLRGSCDLLAEFRELFASGLIAETLLVTSCARHFRACVGGIRGDRLLLFGGLSKLRILLRHRTGFLRRLLRCGLCLTRCLRRDLRLLRGLARLLRSLLIRRLLVAAFRGCLLRVCLRSLRIIRGCVGCIRCVARFVRCHLRGLRGLLCIARCRGFFGGLRRLLCVLRGGTGFLRGLRCLLRSLRIRGVVCLLLRGLRGLLRGLCSLRGFVRSVGCLVRGLLRSVRFCGLGLRHRGGFVRGGLREILRLLRGLRCLLRLLRGLGGMCAGFLIVRLLIAALRRRVLRGRLRLLRIARGLLCRLRSFAGFVRCLLCVLRGLGGRVRLCDLLGGLRGLLRVLRGGCRFVRGFRSLLFRGLITRGLRICLRGLGGFLRGLRRLCGLLRGLGCVLLRGISFRLLLLRLLADLLRDFVLLLRRIFELLRGIGDRVLPDRAQLLLHRGILRQLRLEFLEELLRILLRHLGEHLRVRLLRVEILLDAEFLLRLAHRRARVIRGLALLHFFKVLRDLLQCFGELLLLLRGAHEVGLLLLRRARGGILQGLLGLRRRILQHCKRVVSVAHLLALILFQDVLLVRLRAHEILQRLDLLVELLLLRDLLLRLGLRVVGIFLLRVLGALLGPLLHLGLLLRKSRSELAHGRRQLCQFLARLVHRLAEKIERELHLPGELLGVLAHRHGNVVVIRATAHLAFHRAPRFELLRLRDDRLRIAKNFHQVRLRLRRLRARKLLGDRPQPRLQPAPVARRIRARGEVVQLPALARCELCEAVHRLLQIVPALQHAENRVQFVELPANLRGVGARRDREQRLQRGHRVPHIGHELVVRAMPDFLEVAVHLEKFACHFPPRIREHPARIVGERRLLPDRLQRFRELQHRGIRGPGVLRGVTHQRDRAEAQLAVPVVECARRTFDRAVEFPELRHRELHRGILDVAINRKRLHQPLAVPLELEGRSLRALFPDTGARAHRREDVLDDLRLRSRHLEPARKRRPLCIIRLRGGPHFHQSLLLADEDEAVLREHRGLLGKRDRLGEQLGAFRTARNVRRRLQCGRLHLARRG